MKNFLSNKYTKLYFNIITNANSQSRDSILFGATAILKARQSAVCCDAIFTGIELLIITKFMKLQSRN